MIQKFFLVTFLIFIATLFGLVATGNDNKIVDKISAKFNPITKKTGCPYFIAAGSHHGDIHMPVGTIFGYETKDGQKLYDIIRDDTFIMSAYFIKSFDDIFKCFRTEELAAEAGYKKFLSDQAVQKKRRLEAQEWLNKSPEERMKDCDPNSEECTAKLLQNIDSVIGF